MKLQVKAARAMKWQAVEIGGRQLLSLFVFATLARLLEPSAFGAMTLVGVYLSLVAVLTDCGVSTALIQRKDLDARHLDSAFWFQVAIACVLCAATVVLASPAATLLGDGQLAGLLRWSSIALIINALAGVHGTLFIREMNFRSPTIRTLLAGVIGGAVGLGLALRGYGVWALVGQQLAASLAGTVFLWSASRWRPALRFSPAHFRDLLSVSTSVSGVSILYLFSSRLDQVLIGRYMGTNLLGEYIVGGKLAELAKTALQQPVAAVSMPALSRIQDEPARLCNAIYRAMEPNAIVLIPCLVGLAAIAPDLVPLLFGKRWVLAPGILQLMSMYSLATGVFIYCHPAIISTGAMGRYLLLHATYTIGAVLACVIGLHFGVHAVILGLIVNAFFGGALALWFLRQLVGLSPWKYLRPCLEPCAAAAAMFVLLTYLRPVLHSASLWTSVIIQVLLGVIIYAFIIHALIPFKVNAVRELVVSAFAGQRPGGAPATDVAPAINANV